MSRPASSSSSGRAGSPESAWRRSELVPLLLAQVPQHTLTVNFDKHAKKTHAKHEGGGHALGESIPLEKLTHAPLLDWPLDAAEPEALWTVAAVRLAHTRDTRASAGKRRRARSRHSRRSDSNLNSVQVFSLIPLAHRSRPCAVLARLFRLMWTILIVVWPSESIRTTER